METTTAPRTFALVWTDRFGTERSNAWHSAERRDRFAAEIVASGGRIVWVEA